MTQTGRVTAVSKDGITISVVRETACGESCASCSARCELKNCTVTAEYRDGINKGDLVVFEMAAKKVLFAAFLVYITPLLVLLSVYGVFMMLGSREEIAVVGGIAAMVIWFVIIHFTDKRMKPYYKHTIISKTEVDD